MPDTASLVRSQDKIAMHKKTQAKNTAGERGDAHSRQMLHPSCFSDCVVHSEIDEFPPMPMWLHGTRV